MIVVELFVFADTGEMGCMSLAATGCVSTALLGPDCSCCCAASGQESSLNELSKHLQQPACRPEPPSPKTSEVSQNQPRSCNVV